MKFRAENTSKRQCGYADMPLLFFLITPLRRIGEAMVTKYIPFIPQHGAGGLGMGVLSYNGTVGLGIVTEDDFLVGGPADICDRFSKEFAELLASAKAKAAGGSTEGKKDM